MFKDKNKGIESLDDLVKIDFADKRNDDIESGDKKSCMHLIKNTYIRQFILFCLILIVYMLSFKNVVVSGSSMFPTLKDGDFLIVNKISYVFGEAERGDIVVFPHNDVYYIKRVVAIEGDNVKITGGKLYVNGKPEKAEYFPSEVLTAGEINIDVKKGKVFVLGDNRGNSLDSRYFGTVDKDILVGEVILRIYPFSSFGGVK
ncbi:MAG: signal peptidase I [Eubacteriales bacterium]|nr:signal peptidase I [Eubacteriales bacterium]MDY3333256.1 signal peptidase I [Gallibacter sp.]